MHRYSSAVLGIALASAPTIPARAQELLNVSYDPTREFYQEFNTAFARQYKAKTGRDVTIQQSHGGSGKQARAVIDGLEADVVTLALAYDIDAVAEGRSPAEGLAEAPAPQQLALHLDHRLPGAQGQPQGDQGLERSREAGHPGHHAESEDLGRRALELPRGLGVCAEAAGRNEAKAREFVAALFKNVPVLDSGARGSTTTFVQRGIGDVLLAWENEAFLSIKELGPDKVDIVVPSLSILAEPPVTVVDKVVDKKGTRAVAEAYLEYLYTAEGQEIAAKNYYRPRLEAVAKKYASVFPKISLITIDEVFGGWQKAQKAHFADGGVFDLIYAPR